MNLGTGQLEMEYFLFYNSGKQQNCCATILLLIFIRGGI
jgi:hypothetical protein